MSTAQEKLWAGEFGDAYTLRNRGEALVAARTALWSRALARCERIESLTELGSNLGLNLMALRRLLPDAAMRGVEINPSAAEELRRNVPGAEVVEGSFLERRELGTSDLALTCGVLIHVPPDALPRAYDVLARVATRYVVVCEYYAPKPVSLAYRGHENLLFKRDFAGEFMDAHPFRLLDYGFVYHRDPQFPMDDLNWFTLERK